MRFCELCKAKARDVAGVRVPTVAFLGDSVTEGCFGFDDDVRGSLDYDMVYHAQLKRMLQKLYGRLPLNVLNAGVGGESAPMGLARLERDVLRHRPDLCVVCFGLNDAGAGPGKEGAYRDALRMIFRRLREDGIEAIALLPHMMCVKPPHFPYPNPYEEYAAKIAGYMNDGTVDGYMQAAREAAAEEGAALCDCYALWRRMQTAGVDTDRLLDNKINHISRDMHAFVAKALLDTILFSD